VQRPFLSRKFEFVVLLLSAVAGTGWGEEAISLQREIGLPGVEGRIDHFSADIPGQRLFVAALGNGSVEVIDLQRWTSSSEIKELKEPQGVCYNPKTNRLYVATGGDGRLRIYDGKSLTLQTTLNLGSDADNIRIEADTGDIWVGFGSGGIAIIDSKGQQAGLISLGSHPESFQFDRGVDRVYANVPKQLGVAVIDRKKRVVLTKWGVNGSFANYPMALDEGNKRLFIGCRLPSRLVILDTTTGRFVGALPTVGDSDDIFYDSGKRRVYVIGGEGAVEVFGQNNPDQYESLGRIRTAPGARTGFFSSLSGYLFVAVPHRGAQTAKVLVYKVQ
jgi:DNA-binding beta-propeller fold protein YncE